MRSLRQWIEDFILHISRFNKFLHYYKQYKCEVWPVNKELNSAYIMLQQLFWKYFRYARMTSLKFSKFNLSAAKSNIYAQFAPVSRVVYSAYFTFQ